MLCPKCQNEFPDWHFYCTHCRTQVQDYLPDEALAQPSLLERVGRVVLDLLVLAFFIGAGVLLWRAIKWQDLFDQLRPTNGVLAPFAGNRPLPSTQRASESAAQQSKATTAGRPERTSATESARQLPQKLEALPPTAATASKPTPTINSPATVQPVSQSSITADTAAPNVTPVDARQSTTGLIAVNSQVPARIYVDGQFAGVTPHTVRLAAGNYQLKLIAEGYEDWTRRVRLKNQQQLSVTASLKKRGGQ